MATNKNIPVYASKTRKAREAAAGRALANIVCHGSMSDADCILIGQRLLAELEEIGLAIVSTRVAPDLGED